MSRLFASRALQFEAMRRRVVFRCAGGHGVIYAREMLLILLIILILLVFGGGGGYYGRRAGWGARGYGTGLIVTILIVVLLVWVVNAIIEPPIPIPAGVPSIIQEK